MVKLNKMILGYKKKELFETFISKFIPENIETYCEPFGVDFCVHTYLKNKPVLSIYNDINTYDKIINADIILHADYKEIFKKYDSQSAEQGCDSRRPPHPESGGRRPQRVCADQYPRTPGSRRRDRQERPGGARRPRKIHGET